MLYGPDKDGNDWTFQIDIIQNGSFIKRNDGDYRVRITSKFLFGKYGNTISNVGQIIPITNGFMVLEPLLLSNSTSNSSNMTLTIKKYEINPDGSWKFTPTFINNDLGSIQNIDIILRWEKICMIIIILLYT